MADQTALASALQSVPHLSALETISQIRFSTLDISKLMVYLIDTVDESALISLSNQFDVVGIKGFGLAVSTDEKRQILKRAIELHKYKGTPYAIKQALLSIGYESVTILEHVGNYYDGSFDYDGSRTYGDGNWALFKVIIDIGDKIVGQAEIDLINAMISEYKNVRSKLVDLDLIQAGVPIDILDALFSLIDISILSVENEISITSIERGLVGAGEDYTAICETVTPHGLSTGDRFKVTECAQAGYNGLHIVKSAPSTTVIKYQISDSGLTEETGAGKVKKEPTTILINATVNLKINSDYGATVYIRNQTDKNGDKSFDNYDTMKTSASGKYYRVVMASGGSTAEDAPGGYGIDLMTMVDGFNPATDSTYQVIATASLDLERYNQIDDTI